MKAGQTVTHYKLQKRLGAGGMGEVWLAEDTRLQRSVAIKFISPLLGTDGEIKDRFLREARAAAKLGHHPHVVPVHELGEADGSTFIVMDYVEGESLREVLGREGRGIPLLDSIRWGREIADGLSEAHRAGITHRDIKPDNILLDRKRNVRIADFGLARLASSTQLTQTGAGMGTLKYMSPEQATGKNVDHRTDLFSLGATLYELLAGEPAFQGDDPPALVYAVAHTEPTPLIQHLDDLPPPLIELVEAMLRKNPDHRPQSAEVVARELERMMAALSRGEQAPDLVMDAPMVDATVPLGESPSVPKRPSILGLRGTALKLAAGVIVIAGLAWGAYQIAGRDTGAPGQGAQTTSSGPTNPGRQLAIFPFSYEGPPESAHYAREVATMLDFVLEGTGDFRIVKTDSLLQHIDDEALDATQPGVAQQLAGEFQANRYITGTLRAIGTGFQVDAQLRGASGAVLLEARERANQESDFQGLMDRVGIKLLEGLFDAPTDGTRRVALLESGSIEAIKALLRGVTHNKRWEIGEALAAFQQAAALDSTFALAHFKVSTQIFLMSTDLVKARETASRAVQNSDGLPAEYKMLLEAWYQETQGEIDRAEQAYREVLQIIPNSVEANLRLAAVLWTSNSVRGRSPAECIPYLERIFELEPRYPGVFQVLLSAYFVANDMVGLERAHFTYSDAPPNAYWQYQMACAGDDRQLQDALADTLEGFTVLNNQLRIMMTVRIGSVPDNHRNILAHYARMPDSLISPLEHLLADATRGLAEAGLGKWTEASAWLDRIPSEYALHALEYKALLMAVPILDVSEAEIREMIDVLRTWPKTDRGIVIGIEDDYLSYTRYQPHFEIHPHIRLYLLALLHARIGDLDAARSFSRELDAIDSPTDWSVSVENLRAGARAMVAYAADDYVTALDHLNALPNKTVQGRYALFSNRTWEIYLRGLLLSRMGRGKEALPWFQKQPSEFRLVLMAPGHLERARIYDDLGDTEKAVEYYTRFVDLWRDADPELQPQVEEARERLVALSS